MSELTQIVWFIVLFPMVCAITIFVTVIAHNKAQHWRHQRFGTVAAVDNNTTDDCCYDPHIESLFDPLETMEWGDRDMTCEQYKQKGGSTGNSIPAQMEVVCHRVRDIESLLVMDTTGGRDPYFDDKTDVVTLFKKEIASLKDEIKEIKSDGYHWNVLTNKLVESEERNISRMESTEGDVRNIMSNLHRMDDDIQLHKYAIKLLNSEVEGKDYSCINLGLKGDRDDTDRSSE